MRRDASARILLNTGRIRVLAAGLLLAHAATHSSTAIAVSSTLPSKTEVLSSIALAGDYAQRRYPARVQAYWDDGVYHIGIMALHEATRSPAALAYTQRFGEYNGWTPDRGVMAANSHNRLAAVQSWIAAYQAGAAANLDGSRAEIAAQTSASLSTLTADAYFAVDSQFTALPAFSMLGRLDANASHYRRLYELFSHTKTTLGLYDPVSRLYYRDATFVYPKKRTPDGRKVFWSRGNGWALAALARVLRDLPLDDPARAEYVATFKQMSAALKAVQRDDGYWNMSLDDPLHHPGPETSGTALFVYGMAWGIRNGLLPRSTYLPVVARGWNAMTTTALHPDGKLGYVQGVGLAPVPTTKVTYDSSADFGVGVFLLAGGEVAKLAVDGTRYEAEQLTTTVSTGEIDQDVGDRWASAGFYNRTVFVGIGDTVEYVVSLPRAGTYNVKVRYAKAPDLGRWLFYSAGIDVGAPQDGYSSAFRYVEANLGSVTYATAGRKVFRYTVTGKDASSLGYGTAIDYVMLTRQ